MEICPDAAYLETAGLDEPPEEKDATAGTPPLHLVG
jgi:hypothetical protein